jgi:hypothetical protein
MTFPAVPERSAEPYRGARTGRLTLEWAICAAWIETGCDRPGERRGGAGRAP